jgi:hypothetical protein
VLFIDGQRRYACGADCRAAVLAEARGVRLGETLAAPGAAPPDRAPPEVAPASPARAPSTTVTPATGGEVIPLRAPGSRVPQGQAEGRGARDLQPQWRYRQDDHRRDLGRRPRRRGQRVL